MGGREIRSHGHVVCRYIIVASVSVEIAPVVAEEEHRGQRQEQEQQGERRKDRRAELFDGHGSACSLSDGTRCRMLGVIVSSVNVLHSSWIVESFATLFISVSHCPASSE